MTAIRTEIITSYSELERLATWWHRLWRAGEPRNVFTSFAWARASWGTYGAGQSLATPVVFQGDRVAAILPVAVQEGRLQFLGSPRADYNDILCEPGVDPAVLDSALAALHDLPVPWKRCVLENLPEASALVRHLRSKGPEKLGYMHLTLSAYCPRVIFAPDGETLSAILKKKSLRRHENKLKRLGDITFRHLDDREAIAEHLPEFFRQHIARRAFEEEPSIFHDLRDRDFYAALADELDPRTDLRFGVLEVGDRPVAYHFGFETDGNLLWYKPTFDPDFWDYSPGEVLIKRLFEYAGARGLRTFDFTVGNEAFKHRFANQVARNYALHVYPSGFQGRARLLGHRVKDRVRDRFPRTFRAAKGAETVVRNAWSDLRTRVRQHGIAASARQYAVSALRRMVLARDELLVLAFEGENGEPPCPQLRLEPGTLGELAALSERDPQVFTAQKLTRARDRMRAGDPVFLARGESPLVFLASVALPEELKRLGTVTIHPRAVPGKPDVVFLECWTALQLEAEAKQCSRALQALAFLFAENGQQAWVCCRGEERALSKAAVAAGFQLKYRLHRKCLLGRWTGTRAIAVASSPQSDDAELVLAPSQTA